MKLTTTNFDDLEMTLTLYQLLNVDIFRKNTTLDPNNSLIFGKDESYFKKMCIKRLIEPRQVQSNSIPCSKLAR